MRQKTRTEHTLEMRRRPDEIFVPASAGMFKDARYMADHGRISEALDKACDVYIENYGDMHGVTFRVVTTSKTISVISSWDSIAGNEP